MKWRKNILTSPTIWFSAGWWSTRKIASQFCGQFYQSSRSRRSSGGRTSTPVNYLTFDDERSVRFDAIIVDDQERFYDVEMQIANQPGLGKRIRYYQAVLCPVKLTL